MHQLFQVIYFAGIVAEMVIRMPYDRLRRQIPKTDQRVTRAEYSALTVLFVGGLLLPAVHSLTPWLDFANYRWSPAVAAGAGSVGVAFLGATLYLFWRSHHDLGRNWSPSLEVGMGHRLITQGIYRTIRHPMYASQVLCGIAQILLLQNWIAGPASLAAFLPFYYLRVPQEERMMLDHFGEEYRAYCARTGRILPPLRGGR